MPVAAPVHPPSDQMVAASVAPDTPAVDAHQYKPFQAMSAAPSTGTPSESKKPPRVTGGAPVQRGRLVVIARDGGEGPSYAFGDSTDIGRTEGNVVIPEDRYISPRHARVARVMRGGTGEVVLRDLGSVNGVYLRIPSGLGSALGSADSPGAKPEDPRTSVTLRDQDLFLVGQQVLRFEVVKDADEGFGSASEHGTLLFGTPAAPRYARVSQRTVEGVTRDVFYIRKVETVLGRESGDIVFTDDPFLSRRHATIRVDKENKRYSLSDLGSSNGTFLQIREEVRLKDGDHFRIGQQLFRIDLNREA
jgi:pSer/pThr/pTyr-binding forkhead associated (FHA) protein